MTEVVVSSGPLTRSSSAATATTGMTTRSTRQQTQSQTQSQKEHQTTAAAAALANPPSSDSLTSTSSSFRGPMTRKRAASINTEEASHSGHPRIQDLSLHTPTTASPSHPRPPTSASSLESAAPRDLICLCTPAPKVPRPRNAFILYRQHRQAQVVAQNPGLANPEISKIIGDEWRAEPEERKNQWKQLAEEEKQRHARQYPDYRYQPRRGNKGGPPRLATSSGGIGSGEDPGHCPKCGGRYIATPRTPLTPFVSPPLSSSSPASKTWSMAHPSQSHHPNAGTPRPDFVGSDGQYYRHGSIQQPMSALRGRGAPWHGHGALHDIREEYDAMSATMSPSDPKRRRYHGYQALPSPPGTYGGPSRHSSIGGGPLPNPPMISHSAGGPVLTPVQGHMGPPPRPGAMSRHEFDDRESLRLPPLQTQQLPTSPDSDKSMAYYHVPGPQHVQHAQHAHPPHGQQPPQQPPSAVMMGMGHDASFEERLMSIPFYNKLMALERINPRLPPPSAAVTRGPIIAIDGPDPDLLRIIGPAVERALLMSRECDVRSWYPPSAGDFKPGDVQMSDRTPTQQQQRQQASAGSSRSGSVSTAGGGPGTSASPKDNPFVKAFQEMIEWHAKAAEIVKFVSSSSPHGAAEDNHKLPVALLPAGYSLTHSDRAAILASGRDHYEFVDHWQWTGSLWRGIPGPDLVIYVTHAQGPGPAGEEEGVEVKAPGLMVVKARVGEALSEKTDRRLGFEVVEWVRGGVFWSFWRGGDGGSSSS